MPYPLSQVRRSDLSSWFGKDFEVVRRHRIRTRMMAEQEGEDGGLSRSVGALKMDLVARVDGP